MAQTTYGTCSTQVPTSSPHPQVGPQNGVLHLHGEERHHIIGLNKRWFRWITLPLLFATSRRRPQNHVRSHEKKRRKKS
jgi:hypothetical protein